jgi:hypothetical protein
MWKRPELFKRSVTTNPLHRYFNGDVVMWLAWPCDSESYASGSVATGRVSHAGQVKGDDPDKKRYPGLPPIKIR